jgi:hypothetical protein
MATYIIVKNILEGSLKQGEIKKIELTKKGGGMFMEMHGIIRNLYENGFFMRSVTPETIADRKKRKMARVMIFKNDKRMDMGFEYTLQNKKIDFTNVEIEPVNDGECPHCGNEDPDWGDHMVEGGSTNQEVHCNACGCHWHNVYKFSGVEIH